MRTAYSDDEGRDFSFDCSRRFKLPLRRYLLPDVTLCTLTCWARGCGAVGLTRAQRYSEHTLTQMAQTLEYRAFKEGAVITEYATRFFIIREGQVRRGHLPGRAPTPPSASS